MCFITGAELPELRREIERLYTREREKKKYHIVSSQGQEPFLRACPAQSGTQIFPLHHLGKFLAGQ